MLTKKGHNSILSDSLSFLTSHLRQITVISPFLISLETMIDENVNIFVVRVYLFMIQVTISNFFRISEVNPPLCEEPWSLQGFLGN